jgi:hypothetical protein
LRAAGKKKLMFAIELAKFAPPRPHNMASAIIHS